MTFISEAGNISTITLAELLTNFNAVDFNVLIEGDYLATEPDGATLLTANRYNNYLWLLKKTTAAAGSSEGAARQVAVFKLLSVQENEFDNLAELTYVQLVGEFIAATDLIEGILVSEGAVDRDFPLGAFFTSAALTGNSNPDLVTATLTGLDLNLSFAVDENGTATITLLGTLTNGEAVEISFLVTVDAVNDAPSFNISNSAPVHFVGDGPRTLRFTVSSGPADEFEQTVTLEFTRIAQTPSFENDVIDATSLSLDENLDLPYTPVGVGQVVFEVVANNGQAFNNLSSKQPLTITAGLQTVVVPNSLESTEGVGPGTSVPFNTNNTDSSISARDQTRYPASQFTELNGLSARITKIAYRPNGGFTEDFGPYRSPTS